MKSSTFCVLPYYAYETANQNSRNIHCCRWPAGTNALDVQKSIEKNEQNPACSACWELEKNNKASERIIHNRTMDSLLDRDIELICEDALNGKAYTAMVKLHSSNLCNSTCLTCGPELSTAWQKLTSVQPVYQILNHSELPDLDWHRVKYLSFVGGEPLLEKKNFEVLENLVKAGNTDVFVTIVTNGSILLNKDRFNLLKQFNKLNICVSIDGVGPAFEYMRYPLKFNELIVCLDQFKQLTSNISASVMISNINIYGFSDLDKFLDAQGINRLYKQITQPDYFHPSNLPEDLKQLVLEHNNNHPTVASFLNMTEFEPALWEECIKNIQRQDNLKKISINDYFPQWAQALKDSEHIA